MQTWFQKEIIFQMSNTAKSDRVLYQVFTIVKKIKNNLQSGPTCKELEIHHTCPYSNKKAEEKKWKSTTLLKLIRELKPEGKPLPWKLQRQVDTENHTVQEAKPGKINLQLEPVSVGTL